MSISRVEHLCVCGVRTVRLITDAPCTCDGCGAVFCTSDCPPAGVNEADQPGSSEVLGQRVGISGRPALFQSAAARVKAHRAGVGRLDVRVKPETKATIKSIADALDASQNEVIDHLIRFALANRNWKRVGLMGRQS